MKMNATLVGARELEAKLRRVEAEAPAMMQTALMAGGEVVRTAVVTNITQQGLRKSGTLARSIHVEPDK